VAKLEAAPPVRVMAAPEVRPIAPAELFPMETAPVEVPVLILVAKLLEALILVVAPEMVAPRLPVRS
jgi:hypothetical protein